jgi:hypothetical protein
MQSNALFAEEGYWHVVDYINSFLFLEGFGDVIRGQAKRIKYLARKNLSLRCSQV